MLLPSGTDYEDVAVYPSSPPLRGTSLVKLRGLGDEQLTQLVATGSEPAFAVIYDRYMPALLRYCRRILGSSDDAEDAAQAAMVRAMSALGKRPPRHLRPWLYRIAHNEAIGLARKNSGATAQLDPEQADTDADPARAAATRARLSQLLSDLHALPGRQRDALVLRELCGRSYASIAAELGTSEGAAQQAVFEARASLHEYGQGRDIACTEIQRAISDCEHRRLRSRRVRAHLRSCERCASFERALYARRRDFALLLPWVGPLTMPEILGLAGGTHALVRIARLPVPPDGMRAIAAVTASAALAVTGLTLSSIGGPPSGHAGTGGTGLPVRFSSNLDPRHPPVETVATLPSRGAGRTPSAAKSTTAPAQTAGAQSTIPTSSAADVSAASGGGATTPPRSSGGGATGGVHDLRLPAQTPGVGQTINTVKSVGNTISGTVNNAGATVQGTVKSVGGAVSQTVSGATNTVKSTTQTVGHLLP